MKSLDWLSKDLHPEIGYLSMDKHINVAQMLHADLYTAWLHIDPLRGKFLMRLDQERPMYAFAISLRTLLHELTVRSH